MENIEKVYRIRFNKEDLKEKLRIWKILTENFFQKYISSDDVVIDLAAGYCEFINNVKCKKKIAVDISLDVRKFAQKDVQVIINKSNNMKDIKANTADVVFVSNFFEHITTKEIDDTMREIKRVLKSGGKLLILQPNIKYAYKQYWDYYDHITPISHMSLIECLHKHNFHIEEIRPKFLPFTTKSNLPNWSILIKLYLKLKIAQKMFGQQTFVYAVNKK